MAKKPRRQGRAARAVSAVGALMGATILQVFAVRFVDPPATPLMLARWARGVFSHDHPVPIRYRWRDLEEMPDHFLTAVLMTEDQRFFDHHGFDWTEMREALGSRTQGRPLRGASTITMQCARSVFLWQGRSWVRKGLEAYYTVLMERLLPKRRILELYVNAIELGDGVYGLEEAARHYYGVPADRLTGAQASALAAILTDPRVLDPREPSEWVQMRQRAIEQRVAQAPFLVRRRLEGQSGHRATTEPPGYDPWGPLWI